MANKESKNDNKIKKHFFKDFKAELKKVIWPTPKQLANNTVAVITIVLITALIVFILDAVFDLGNKYGISKLQSVVDEKFNAEENTESTTGTESTENTESTESTNSTENTSEATNQENSNSNETSTENSNEQSNEAESSNEASPTEQASPESEATNVEQ